MPVEKTILGHLPMVYAVSAQRIGDQQVFLAATELHGPCLAFNSSDPKPVEVWDRPGGTMSLVPVHDGSGRFLAIQQAWPIYHFEHARVVDVRPTDSTAHVWQSANVLDLPFAHRLALFEGWVIGATMAGGKTAQEDWSSPGSVIAAPLPSEWGTPLRPKAICEGIRRNHGMTTARLDGLSRLFVSGIDGVFMLTAPPQDDGEWACRRLLNHDVSDMAVFDIDGDGEPELITIEPFHGDCLVFYKRVGGGCWRAVARLAINFGHVVWAGSLNGRPALIVGNRGGNKAIVLMRPRRQGTLEMSIETLDTGTGPANIVVIGSDTILSANHAAGEIALYRVRD